MKKETKHFGSTPEIFINKNVAVCPMCGSSEPRWSIESRKESGTRFSFKCESCESILSAHESYIHKWNRKMLSTVGCSDLFIRNKREQVKLKVDSVRGVKLTCINCSSDFSLKDIKKFVNSLTGYIEEAPKLQ